MWVATLLQAKIAEYKTGKLTLLAGCNEEQSLEQSVMGVLNRIRNTASDVRTPSQSLKSCPSFLPSCASEKLHCMHASTGNSVKEGPSMRGAVCW